MVFGDLDDPESEMRQAAALALCAAAQAGIGHGPGRLLHRLSALYVHDRKSARGKPEILALGCLAVSS